MPLPADQYKDPQYILEVAIQKACDNGFLAGSGDFVVNELLIDWTVATEVTIQIGYEVLIYMKPFAKALWGQQAMRCRGCGQEYEHFPDCPAGDAFLDSWMEADLWHLQQMVIADDPIQYLGANMVRKED